MLIFIAGMLTKQKTRISLLCVLLCICFSKTYAQRYPFYNLGVENGLIQSQVMDITQDKYGHLWIGTLGGLARYDGKNFTNYTVRDGLMNNEVDAIAFDKKGKLWIGTPSGLSAYDGKKFTRYKFSRPDKPNSSSVAEVQIDDNDKVWCLADNRIYSIAKGKTQKVTVPGPDSSSAILCDKDGIWVAQSGGPLFHLVNGKWDSLIIPPNPMNGRTPVVTKIFKDKTNKIWLTTGSGMLFYIAGGKIVQYEYKGSKQYFLSSLLSIADDNKGDLWIGMGSGVARISENSLIFYTRQNGLSDNSFRCMYDDAEGNVWMGSDGQGIFRSSGSPFTVVDESMGLKSGQVRSLVADATGKLYFGTMDNGLYTYEQGKVSPLVLPNFIKPAITAMTMFEGKVWMGTQGAGIITYNGTFKYYKSPNNNNISALYADNQHRLWIGYNDGAKFYQADSFHEQLLNDILVRSFIQIGSDSILIATNNNGLKLYHAGSVSDYKTNTAVDSSSALCFTLRGADELWIGTSDNGVIRYNMRTGDYLVINKNNGLRSDFIYNIITDNSNNVWVGTGFGIHRINVSSDGGPVIKFFGKGQGVAGMESNHNAIYKMNDGSIWFGTTNGALHYQAQSQSTDTKPLSIVLQSVKLFGETITDTSYFDDLEAWYKIPLGLHLPPKKNNLTFSFQAISLGSGNEQITYRYRIEGLDAPWSDWSPTNSVTFSALPSGKYTLHVESNTGGELHYPFEIITPFHKTGWFRLLVLAGCILLGITLQYIANKMKQNRIKLIERTRREEQNKVRQRTAEDFHDEVGNKLTRINVLANVLKNKIQLTPETQRIIGQIEDNTSQLYSGTKDILWSLKPSNDGLYEVLHRIRDFGGELFQDTDIDFIFLGTDMRWKAYKLPMDVGRNLIMIFKEALNNTLKYSKATEVKLDVRIKMRNVLQMTLRDNGEGFDIQTVKKGHGIDNMYVRAKRIKGRFYIDSKQGKGTIINLAFRLPPKESRASKKEQYH